jgi:hypothetical protein
MMTVARQQGNKAGRWEARQVVVVNGMSDVCDVCCVVEGRKEKKQALWLFCYLFFASTFHHTYLPPASCRFNNSCSMKLVSVALLHRLHSRTLLMNVIHSSHSGRSSIFHLLTPTTVVPCTCAVTR